MTVPCRPGWRPRRNHCRPVPDGREWRVGWLAHRFASGHRSDADGALDGDSRWFSPEDVPLVHGPRCLQPGSGSPVHWRPRVEARRDRCWGGLPRAFRFPNPRMRPLSIHGPSYGCARCGRARGGESMKTTNNRCAAARNRKGTANTAGRRKQDRMPKGSWPGRRPGKPGTIYA